MKREQEESSSGYARQIMLPGVKLFFLAKPTRSREVFSPKQAQQLTRPDTGAHGR